MIRVFLALGVMWFGYGLYQYFLTAAPDGQTYAFQSLMVAVVNLLVAGYLKWRKDRRGEAER